MKNRNPLTDWVIEKIEREYKDDISLLIAVKGHSSENDGHGEVFDYYVPETKRGDELSRAFIIDGVGHDLYPRSWERLERSARLDDMAILLANAEILYAGSEEAAGRFHALQRRLADNLADPVFVYRKALECVDNAADLYRALAFEEKSYRARAEAGRLHLYLSKAVAYMNHTYAEAPIFSERQAYDDTPESRTYHCPDMKIVPDAFFACGRRLLACSDIPGIRETARALVETTRRFVLARKPLADTREHRDSYEDFAGWYQEMSLTWRRLRYFCRENRVEEAYKDACVLQEEFLVIAEEFGIEELNLLDSFDPDDLSCLDMRSRKLEQTVREMILERGLRIDEYASLEEFLAANKRTGGEQ